MTAPKNDGRPMLERARELVNTGGGYVFHERSGDGYTALAAAMSLLELALRWYRTGLSSDLTAFHAALTEFSAPGPGRIAATHPQGD